MHSLSDLCNSPIHVLFESVAGSRAYGTANAESDEDIRGVFALSASAYLGLQPPPAQLADERQNQVYFSLRRTIELLAAGNPNILELLHMPKDCVRRHSPEMETLEAGRCLFITRECVKAHVRYAFSQIKKARGQNKWINNPKPREAPTKDAFCHIIPDAVRDPGEGVPMRPIPLAESGWSLGEYHAARLEQTRDVFRLYHYGAEARGVFRNDTISLQPIPIEDERTRFAGLLIFREQAWRQACDDHRNYWAWLAERNESRWQAQERGELDYDAKNLMHTIRLLLSAQSMLRNGLPIIRFSGEARELLLRVRSGTMSYEEIMNVAQDVADECDREIERSDLPESCDTRAADRLLADLTAQWERRCR